MKLTAQTSTVCYDCVQIAIMYSIGSEFISKIAKSCLTKYKGAEDTKETVEHNFHMFTRQRFGSKRK